MGHTGLTVDRWFRTAAALTTGTDQAGPYKRILCWLLFLSGPLLNKLAHVLTSGFLPAACCDWSRRGVGLSGFEPGVVCLLLFATVPFKICCSCFLILFSDGTVPACDQCRKASLSPSNNGRS